MLGMMQIMIWLLCVYLVFKGIEIFQIAWMSSGENQRKGRALGMVMIVVAVLAALTFYALEEQMAEQIRDRQQTLPNLTP